MCIETLIQSKLSFPGTKPHFRFSRTMRILVLRPLLSLNDVNVGGGNVIKPFAREIGTSQKLVSLWQIKGK